ncbi:Receptor-like serine/threonine-protein kinase SD1-8 [Dichanthelium oligosanthes]|uniref:Receptor-like serine/threonine-protein kinase n=1 Tax=Dichanthelium oligosanthes TaxID=888268 RepID=A0A1E5WF62_9POAL|nr:Receptor-like serine/threonine-protein kinase SD1-8 [Dichanthelium oligosanthes]
MAPNHRLRLAAGLLLLPLILPAASLARDTIAPGQPLRGNDTLVSSGTGSFALGFFSPPGSNNTYVGVWYARLPVRTVVWVANRADPVHGANAAATLSVSSACELAVAAANGTVVWSASPPPGAAEGPCAARIHDDGNLVVMDQLGRVAWQGFDHPTDTLLPGMRLGVDFAAGKNMTLTAWVSPSDPSPSAVVAAMDTSGDPEVFVWNGATKVWRSGPWDGVQFTGVPDTVTYKALGFSFRFVNNAQEATYSFHVRDASIVSRLALNSTGAGGGLLQRWTWLEAARAWYLYWYAPKDQCDAVSPCGPNGVCDASTVPACACLRGFTPLSPATWALRDGRDGCVRATPLDCANRTDGFAVLPHAKVPDTTQAVVDFGSSLEQCRQRCLRNCSCTAYASANLTGEPGHRGCVMWTGGLDDLRVYPGYGQDLYFRLAAADLASVSKSKKKVNTVVAIVVSITALMAILLAVAGFFIWRAKKTKARKPASGTWRAGPRSKEGSEGKGHGDDLELPVYDYETIAKATEGFSTENKLGEGGFGPVYKGKLEDGQEIAVKTLSRTSTQGFEEFKNEDSRYRIIHRDLKTSNILLDEEMTPKISDFGMARMFGNDDAEINTLRVVGTYGYMAPEYAMDGVFSVKSDVFSFGVIVLEIIAGKRNRGVYSYSGHLNILAHAWSLLNEGKGIDLVDENLNGSFESDEVLKCLKVGLLCVQENPDDRPLMSQVLMMLASTDAASLPTPKQPGFAARRAAAEDTLWSKPDCSVVDSMTITMVEGR